MKVAVFPSDLGGFAVLYPTGELPFEDVLKKDVPNGVPYLVMEASEVPPDGTEIDFSKPHGFGGSTKEYFASRANAPVGN